MKRISRWVRFHIDGLALGGVGAGASFLAAITLVVVVVCGVVLVGGEVRSEDGEEVSFVEASWWSLMRTLDPGTMGGDTGWHLRLTSLAATIAGILVLSVLIGVVTTGIDSRLRELRRGKGAVQLRDHTVILGWSQGTGTLVSELGEANKSRHRPAIAILSDADVSDLRDELAAKIRENKHQRVFIRSGSTTDVNALQSVSAEDARAIVVLHGGVPNPDAENVRTTLAVLNGLQDYKGVIVTQVDDQSLADALRDATLGRVLVVSRRQVMAKVTAQACRSRGLAQVFEDLLDFDGSEIYVRHEPALVGQNFGTAMLSYPESIPIGLLRESGKIDICPDWAVEIGPRDEIIGIAEDDSTFRLGTVHVESGEGLIAERSTATPRSILVIGWSDIASELVARLDENLPFGSSVTVCASNFTQFDVEASTIRLSTRSADVNRLSGLRELVYEQPFDSVVLLCSRDCSVVEDDSLNLMRLLELRQLLAEPQCPSHRANVVTELRAIEDVSIAGSLRGDFVVSDRIPSLLLAQLAEEPKLLPILDSLFAPTGVEAVTMPACRLTESREVTFGDLVKLGMPYGVVLGIATTTEGVKLNPPRNSGLLIDDDLQALLLTKRVRSSN